jgi:hypothetical protein
VLTSIPLGFAGTVTACSSLPPSFHAELDKLRHKEEELRAAWAKDSVGQMKKLPPRAWPPNQPKVDDIPMLRARLAHERCPPAGSQMSRDCEQITFDLATALVFNRVDGRFGFKSFAALAGAGHTDGMVATGVCLTEGLGVPCNETEGGRWLKRASDAGSAQGAYELATLLFTGYTSLGEDESSAFKLYEQAAAQEHTGAMFMVADCLLDGAGCDAHADKSKAVPLLFAAAEKGHLGARQYMRHLWDGRVLDWAV